MQTDRLDPMLVTFMYFLYVENGGEADKEDFYKMWTDSFYTFDDMDNGKFYE